MLFVINNFSSNSHKLITNNTYPIATDQNKDLITYAQLTPSSSKNIEVILPSSNENVKSNFIVKGNARTINDVVYFRLYDSIGNVLTETYANANSLGSGNYGPFEKIIVFNSNDTSGLLEIFQYSDEDGSQIDKVEIPLVFVK